jgi:outer membrane protein TolC
MNEMLKLARQRQSTGSFSEVDVARAEYAVAEADFWLEDAKTR